MILVLLGTNPYSFVRLARAVDALAGRHGWEVFMQTGNTPYRPVHCNSEAFVPRAKIQALVRKCALLVAQGGAGSLRDGLAAGKPVVAVPRQPELGESQDRQEQLVRALEQEGRIIGVYNIQDLESAIARAFSFKPAVSRRHCIPELIGSFLDQT